MGSGIAVLTPAANGTPVAFGTYPQNLLDAGGLVRKLVLLDDDSLWVAAQRGGVVRFVRETGGDQWVTPTGGFTSFRFPANGPDDSEDVRSMCVWEDGTGGVRVLAGTGLDGTKDGTPYLLDPDAAQPLLDSFTLNGEIWAMDAVDGLYVDPGTQEPRVTVVVGTACDGIYRYDFPLSATSIPASTASIGSQAGFVRDVVIDPDTTRARAFTAHHNLGIGMVSLANGGLTVLQPAQVLDPSATPTYALDLDFDEQHEILAVAAGPFFGAEFQYGGESRIPVPCTAFDQAESDSASGTYVFDVSNDQFTQLFFEQGDQVEWKDDNFPRVYAVGLRVEDTENFALDLAAVTGLHSIICQFQGGTWTRTEVDDTYGHDQGMLLITTDEVLFQEDAIYTAAEFALAVSDRAGASPPPMFPPAEIVQAKPVNALAGFPEPDARVFGSGTDGVIFFDTSGANRLDPQQGAGIYRKDGRGYGIGTTTGLGIATLPPLEIPRWLIIVNPMDQTAVPANSTGSLQLIRVDDATSPGDPDVKQVLRWYHRQGGGSLPPLLPNASLYRVAVRTISNLEQAWYVSFGPLRATINETTQQTIYEGERGSGLLTLRVRAELNQQTGGVDHSIEAMSRIRVIEPGPEDPDAEDPMIVTYDAGRGYVYLALGTEGLAVFDVSGDPYTPQFDEMTDFRRFNPDPVPVGQVIDTFYHCLPGPGNSLVLSGFYSGLLHISDYQNIEQSDVTIYRTRYQSIGLSPDTTDPTRSTFYVADGYAGTVRVQIPSTP